MKVSKEIKAIEKALQAYYKKHGGNVCITASVVAFNEEHDVIDDQLWLVGAKEMLETQVECLVEEVNKTKTIFIDYPTMFHFNTDKDFSNNQERTEYLHEVLKNNKVNSPCHAYTDYVVEAIEPIGKKGEREYWAIGS